MPGCMELIIYGRQLSVRMATASRVQSGATAFSRERVVDSISRRLHGGSSRQVGQQADDSSICFNSLSAVRGRFHWPRLIHSQLQATHLSKVAISGPWTNNNTAPLYRRQVDRLCLASRGNVTKHKLNKHQTFGDFDEFKKLTRKTVTNVCKIPNRIRETDHHRPTLRSPA